MQCLLEMLRKRLSTADVLRLIDLSDDELFDDSDSDRYSDNQLDDVEPVSDADSEATEAYDYDIVADDSDNDGSGSQSQPGHLGAAIAATTAAPVFAPRVWVPVDNGYTPKVDFDYHFTPGMNSSINLTAESCPIEFFDLFLTDEILNLLVNETNRFADQFLAKSVLKRKSRAHDWHPTTASF